jgi:hypothetical protein
MPTRKEAAEEDRASSRWPHPDAARDAARLGRGSFQVEAEQGRAHRYDPRRQRRTEDGTGDSEAGGEECRQPTGQTCCHDRCELDRGLPFWRLAESGRSPLFSIVRSSSLLIYVQNTYKHNDVSSSYDNNQILLPICY